MPLWLAAQPVVLASKSEIRRTVLEAAGIPVEVEPADIDERAIEAAHRSDPSGVAALLARAKAEAVAKRRPGRLVIGADQTLALGERIFSKPPDRAAAYAQLEALRGATHSLHSGIAVIHDGAVAFEHVGVARLTMRHFSDAFLDRYLDTVGNAATQSVGAYQLEREGIQLFKHVDGDHFTILGLPLLALLGFLRRTGWLSE